MYLKKYMIWLVLILFQIEMERMKAKSLKQKFGYTSENNILRFLSAK